MRAPPSQYEYNSSFGQAKCLGYALNRPDSLSIIAEAPMAEANDPMSEVCHDSIGF